MLDFDAVLEALDIPAYAEAVRPGWEDSEGSLPAELVFFLDAEWLAEACRAVSLSEDAVPALRATARRVQGSPALQRLAWHYHHLLFKSTADTRPDVFAWPTLENVLGDAAGTFYLLVALSGLQGAQAFHAERGIPQQVRRDTYADAALWAHEWHEAHGVWGLERRIGRWLTNHFVGDLYRLGRLQFMQRPFRGRLRAFRHLRTGEVLAVAEDGVRFRSDGQIDGAGEVHDPEGAWTSSLRVTQEGVRGNPIHPGGYAVATEVFLPGGEWQAVLQQGDPMLEMHIPKDGPMGFDACGESLRRALEFFPRYFPQRPFLGFCCTSWTLDTQLCDLLPASSNLVRFMREFYCYPILTSGRQTFERVFGGVPEDTHDLPRDTALRRALVEHLLAGGHTRSGGIFLLTEDLEWGTQAYLTQPRSLLFA